ncbi:hypothetical protein DV707_17220 (plasmid) [Halobellus limi]|uniref:Small CPxCG-related zinc finger protein n=1 Tax=Halobellus limi TaxID=699433 RepID=A0A4D6H790_9EURY|nr:hypothetical protein DV707_17220 [Halobellus limi]
MRSVRNTTGEEVVCIACGDTISRSDAREYDKYGDRWDREGKTFEYLCKPCHRDCCHQPRTGLEETLINAGAGETEQPTFLRQYRRLAADSQQTES